MTDLLVPLSRALPVLGEMSLTATYAAAVVAALRLALRRRAPKRVLSLLWLVVFARLLIPVSLESPLSIVPDAMPPRTLTQLEDGPEPPLQTAPVQIPGPAQGTAGNHWEGPGPNPTPATQGGPGGLPVSAVPEAPSPAAPQPEAPAPFPWPTVLAGVWLAGVLAMGGGALVSYLRLRRRLFDAIRAPDGAWEHPSVGSPFILGVIRPRIYLPAGLRGQPRQFILCHERAHLRRLDHLVKPLCWAALAVHWFNPAVWLAFVLMSRDIEAACDEAVIRTLGPAVKADYSAIFCILSGAMTIVGPRPERPEIAKQYEETLPAFALRLQVKAGLTGYAQIYGKYNTEPYDKLQMDLMYINDMSLSCDIGLMFATVKILFMPESTEGIKKGQVTASKDSVDTVKELAAVSEEK